MEEEQASQQLEVAAMAASKEEDKGRALEARRTTTLTAQSCGTILSGTRLVRKISMLLWDSHNCLRV